MAASFVRVAPDSTGKYVQTFSNTISATLVEANAVVAVDSAGVAQTSWPVTGTFWQATQPVSGTVTITPPTLTKGTQGTTGLSVQDLKDAGRSAVTIVFNTAAPVVAETLVSAVKTTASVAVAGSQSIAVASGKTLRITNIVLSIRTTTAANPWASLQIRSNPTGATVIGSPSLFRIETGGTAAVIGNTGMISMPVFDGYEFTGTQTLGITLANNVTTNIASVTLIGYEY